MADYSAILVIILAALIGGLLLLGGILLVRDTIRQRGRWGICLSRPRCLKCDEPAPLVRTPASWRQALWGGWTCPKCGFELDKFGHPVSDQPFPAKWSARLDDGRGVERTEEKRDPRVRRPKGDIRRGGDYRD